MSLVIECPPLMLSILGGEAENETLMDDPIVGLIEVFRLIAAPEYPTMGVHGDGVNTWEIAVAETGPPLVPALIWEWKQWFIPEMSQGDYRIYGEVPTDVLLTYIETHDGDPTPLKARLP